jgi:DNA-binding NarL/FixJ family response regulator
MTSDPLAAPEAGGAITVLGTGIMGSAMVRNLAAAGLRTTVWDRLPQATAPLAAAGAVLAGSAQDAISDARVVITMLPSRTRVVLADDDVLLREGLASMLDRSGLEVVGQASDAAGLLELIGRLRPELAVVDIRMPPKYSTEGLEAARVIQRDYPRTAVVVLSAHVEVEHAMDLLATGHRTGYLLKSRVTDVTEFIDTLRRVERGGSAVDPALVQELVAARRADDPLAVLTGREREVLALMAEGRSNAGIGQVLWVTEGTVEKHVRSIMMKLRLPETGEVHRRVLAVLAFLEAR